MLYVHIGFRKTGSTTIQRFVTMNRDALAKLNLDYPKIGRVGRAHFNLIYEARKHPLYRPEAGGMSEFRALIEGRPEADYLISAETFHRLNLKTVRAFAETLPKIKVKVIGYIRPLTSLTVSWYMQNVKMGYYSYDFDRFFAERAAHPEADAEALGEEVFTQIGNWGEVFGWDNLHIRSLDKHHLTDGDLLKDFVAAIGLNWSDLSDLDQASLELRNVSPGWKAVELMRLLHSGAGKLPSRREPDVYLVARDDAWAAHALAEKVAQEVGLNGERGAYLTQAQTEICDTAYKRLVERLNERLSGPPIPLPESRSVEPRPFLPEPSRVPRAERNAFFEGMAMGLAKELRRASERQAAPSAAAKEQEAARQDAVKEERRAVRQAERRARKQQAESESANLQRD